MRINLLGHLFILLVNLGVGYYIVDACRKRFKNQAWAKGALAMICLTIALTLAITVMSKLTLGDTAFKALMWMMMTYYSLFAAQFVFVVVDLLAKIPCLFKRRRAKWLSKTALCLSILSLLTIWWGCIFNRFNIDVEEVEVSIKDLPKAFEGYRIAQISDIHSGTYDSDTTFISRVVDRINQLDVDLVVFTGDIVNRHSTEIEPFIPVLKRVHGRDGQFAILGNHDYAEYYFGEDDPDAARADVVHLCDIYESTAFDILLDENRVIRRGNDSIVVIGVQNISKPPYPNRGNLKKAYPNLSDGATKILLSHDPIHWVDDIADNPDINIALTLSGHTHAAQMKVGRISPAAIIHPHAWAGLYVDSDSSRQLYVNIGLGTVGVPMRLGATPEITILTLTGK